MWVNLECVCLCRRIYLCKCELDDTSKTEREWADACVRLRQTGRHNRKKVCMREHLPGDGGLQIHRLLHLQRESGCTLLLLKTRGHLHTRASSVQPHHSKHTFYSQLRESKPSEMLKLQSHRADNEHWICPNLLKRCWCALKECEVHALSHISIKQMLYIVNKHGRISKRREQTSLSRRKSIHFAKLHGYFIVF